MTVKAGMRFGCSSRGFANSTTCTLVDLGLVTKEDPHLIVDHHKIEREKELVIRELVREAEDIIRSSNIKCNYFDGMKDLSKVRLEVLIRCSMV